MQCRRRTRHAWLVTAFCPSLSFDCSGKGKTMQRIVLALAAFSFGTFASPVVAQQANLPTSDQSMQSVPPEPPPPRYVPPPFPPMPRFRSGHSTRRHFSRHPAMRARHLAVRAHHRRSATHAAKVHLSHRTIRQCHAMNYRQIMRHHYCRALMKREIAAADHRHRATKRHKATAHRHKARRHRHR